MSRIAHDELPPELAELLDGTNLDRKVGETIVLLTVSEGGWPHVAMLSVGELFAPSAREMAMALWPETESGRNLKRTSTATFMAVTTGAGHYIEATVESIGPTIVNGASLDRFRCSIKRVLVDAIDYARLTSGITFTLPDPTSVLARWQRTIEALRLLA